MKVIAFYLPQFHRIPENDKWWGEGFTEWTNIRNAKPLFEKHYQPRIPLNNQYYDLLEDDEILRQQCRLAKRNGIYGFCFYHYWFSGKKLLEKPIEKYLRDKECDLPFCLCWANEDWKKRDVFGKTKMLLMQSYGDAKEWKEHFEYCYPFFKDDRYIRIDGKPVFIIYRPEMIPDLKRLLSYWNTMAKDRGLGGLTFMYQHVNAHMTLGRRKKLFDYGIEFQPFYAMQVGGSSYWLSKLKSYMDLPFQRLFHYSFDVHKHFRPKRGLHVVNYDQVWKRILKEKRQDARIIAGAFVDWDNSPRYGSAGLIVEGANPKKFKKYFSKLVRNIQREGKKEIIFLFAWNEWSEGGYLEPDERYGYGYLHAVRDVICECESKRD